MPCFVATEGATGGRRVSVQHYAYGEKPVTEEWGGLERQFPSTLYVASEQADVESLALCAALQSKGPGLFVLPMEPPVQVHCLSWDRAREKDVNGYIAIDVDIIEAGSRAAFPAGFSVNAAIGGIGKIGASINASLVGGRIKLGANVKLGGAVKLASRI